MTMVDAAILKGKVFVILWMVLLHGHHIHKWFVFIILLMETIYILYVSYWILQWKTKMFHGHPIQTTGTDRMEIVKLLLKMELNYLLLVRTEPTKIKWKDLFVHLVWTVILVLHCQAKSSKVLLLSCIKLGFNFPVFLSWISWPL